MADLIYAISASLDSYIADDNGNFDWGRPPDDAHALFNGLQRSVGIAVPGRGCSGSPRTWSRTVIAASNAGIGPIAVPQDETRRIGIPQAPKYPERQHFGSRAVETPMVSCGP